MLRTPCCLLIILALGCSGTPEDAAPRPAVNAAGVDTARAPTPARDRVAEPRSARRPLTPTSAAGWDRLEPAQAALEKVVAQRESVPLLQHVAVTWIASREAPAAATRSVETLIGRLLGPAARLIRREHRSGVAAFGSWWLCTYEVGGSSAVVGLLRVGGRFLVATCRIDEQQDRCCGRPTKPAEAGPRCVVCRVDARTCMCPRTGEVLLPDEDWRARCTMAQRTGGRALCRGCLQLLVKSGVKARLDRFEERLRRRRTEVKEDLARLARLLRVLEPVKTELEGLGELERRRDELRRGQVAFTELADRFTKQLDTPTQGSPRALFQKLPEQRLGDLERRLKTLRRAAQTQVEVVRQELTRLPRGRELLPKAYPPTPPERVAAPWLTPRTREAAALALATARRDRGSLEWHQLAAIRPPRRRIYQVARQRGARTRALWRRAEACLARDDLDGAVEYYKRAEVIQPLPPSRKRRLARALVLRSVGRAGSGDLTGAERDASEAIRYDAKEAWAWGHRGYCRRRRGDLEGAAKDLRRAHELGSVEAAADLARLANLFAARAWKRNAAGKPRAAVADWRMAWKLEVELGKRGRGSAPEGLAPQPR